MNSYDFWKASIAGEKPKMFVDDPQLGFYRKSINQRNDKGNNRRVGRQPVAVFMDGETITARLGNEQTGDEVTGDQLNELWSYIAGNAITEEWYRAVAREGRDWPDAHDPSKNKPDGKTIAQMREENPNFDKDLETTFAMIDAAERAKAELPENKLAREIAEAKAGVSQYDKIDSDEQAGRALSLKNTITSLAGDLDKHRETLVRPHIDAQREVNDRLNPIIKAAKVDAAALLRAIGTFEDWKREQARKAQAKADKEAAEHAAKVKAAEEAGKPAPTPPPAPVASNAPAPSTQVAAAVGRKASVKVAKVVVKIDLQQAWQQFGGQPEVYELFMTLAQKAVNAGLNVAGAEIEERSIVR